MIKYGEMSKDELISELGVLKGMYSEIKEKNLKLDMSRGKPGADQLDLAMPMLDILNSNDSYMTENNIDIRNYGVLDGVDEAKELFSKMLEVKASQIIIGGNSSLNLMYDTILRAMMFGVLGSEKPWSKCEKIKFLCPVPGYDRHFAITENMGIEMINIPMTKTGPDMDLVEKLVAEDDSIKGIWCVPMYSNPEGVTYSDETVKRFAALKPKANDFRIFWDNAYCVHHLSDTEDKLVNILEEAEKCDNEDIVFIFASTSKVSFTGAGVAMLAASENNINFIKKQMSIQTIGSDKINQIRHVKFFKNVDGIKAHMQKHRAILEPKFNTVVEILEAELGARGAGTYNKPNGGYFVSFNTLDGCAKKVVSLCKEAGVVLTGAGATYPYGKDPEDTNIRIAPTFPPVAELVEAMALFCICVRLATVEKLIAQ